MPNYPRHDAWNDPLAVLIASPTLAARAVSSSEAAALPNGEKALTPIIAGAISGAIIAVAWAVAIVYALVKRHRRKKRFKRAGRPDLMHEQPRPDAFILPPDPAVVQGQRNPGERVYVGKHQKRAARKEEEKRARKKARMLENGMSEKEAEEEAQNVDKPVDEKMESGMQAEAVRHDLADIPEDGSSEAIRMPSATRQHTSSSMLAAIALKDAEENAKKSKRKREKEAEHIKQADFAYDENASDDGSTPLRSARWYEFETLNLCFC